MRQINPFRCFQYVGVVSLVFFLCSCQNNEKTLKTGPWRASLEIKKRKELPFLLDLKADTTMVFYNAEEEILITDITLKGDSITIEHPVFEGIFKGKYTSDSIYGNFIKPSLNRTVPFSMRHGNDLRFHVTGAPNTIITGNWETVFSPNNAKDRYIAKAIFEQTGNRVTGTIRTTTGDYRYLDGVIQDDSLKLSTFDGAHAFLFEAEVKDSLMQGVFYSGNHWKEPFTAKRNDAYKLPSPDSLTFLKEGYEKLAFSFPNAKGKQISLADKQFKNKVVVVQIMGTWCPNCLDETKFLSNYYKKKKSDDLAFVGLAFEYAPTQEKAFAALQRLEDRVGVTYPLLLAQYGSSSKEKAQQKLPMLNHVLSYPTTIFIDKEGVVRKIHTGFNGPATGKEYDMFVQDFERFITELLEE